ncbi:MAG: beta-glucosidase, partial [Bacteroidales bacterium]|nr:beta-glucosidase [Bacteroidales bacterium]
MKKSISFAGASMLAILLLLPGCKKWTENGTGSLRIVTNKGGQTLGYDTASGIRILTVSGLAFKDLNRNNELDLYEDWRLPADE